MGSGNASEGRPDSPQSTRVRIPGSTCGGWHTPSREQVANSVPPNEAFAVREAHVASCPMPKAYPIHHHCGILSTRPPVQKAYTRDRSVFTRVHRAIAIAAMARRRAWLRYVPYTATKLAKSSSSTSPSWSKSPTGPLGSQPASPSLRPCTSTNSMKSQKSTSPS